MKTNISHPSEFVYQRPKALRSVCIVQLRTADVCDVVWCSTQRVNGYRIKRFAYLVVRAGERGGASAAL